MSTSSLAALSRRRDIHLLTVVTVVELCLLAGYFLVRPEQPTLLRYTLYPFIWINVAVLAAIHVDVPDAPRRSSIAAAAIATLYFGVLLYLSGLLGVPATTCSSSLGWLTYRLEPQEPSACISLPKRSTSLSSRTGQLAIWSSRISST
ncbi:DUF7546 family protein [Halovenus salina]|uniref:DUF7546 family protein n=1 Tax=Halovenus salina TaxID=1510225 RepID=UPI0036D39F47